MSPFLQGSETDVPTYFLSVLNTGCRNYTIVMLNQNVRVLSVCVCS